MRFRVFFSGILVALSLVSGALAQALDSKQIFDGSGDNPVTRSTGSILLESVEGDFSALFPTGCSQIREKIIDSEYGGNPEGLLLLTVNAFCDREGFEGEGCSVYAYIDGDLESGPPADPAYVLARVKSILEGFGAEIIVQRPYRKEVEDGPLMEGVDVLAADPERMGQVWVRGLLVEGDVYVLAAWRTTGELATDPIFVAFFDSFKAHGM